MPPKAPSRSASTSAFLRRAIGLLATRLDRACKAVPDVEAVHALRVSCRRLRSLLSLFRDYLPAEAPAVRDRLRELAAAFSPVRDLDVLLIHLEDWRRELGKRDASAMKPVIARLSARRADLVKLSDRSADELAGCARAKKTLQALARAGTKWPAIARRSIDVVAPQLLEVAHGRLIKALDRARRRASLERYHKLRIAGKKLRYALQALSGHYGKPAKPTIKALEAIQDGFGEYLDASRAADVLSEIALEDGWKSATRRACAQLVTRCREHAQAELEAMPALLEKLDEKRWAELLDALTGRKGKTR